jgi:hypothetical protein
MSIERINNGELFRDGDLMTEYENGVYVVLFENRPLAVKVNEDWYFNIDLDFEEHGIQYSRLNKHTVPDRTGTIFLSVTETLNMIIER